jgi:NAD-dependent dihydropyrimidine dehydrogenase PreA subunit
MTQAAECKHDAGEFHPVIDRNRCEGKAECVRVCPYQVFERDTLPPPERRGLSVLGKLKGYAHRWQQAFPLKGDLCHACGLCVAACPEKAITLQRLARI